MPNTLSPNPLSKDDYLTIYYAPLETDDIHEQLRRILEVTECKTQEELATCFSVQLSDIADVIKRGRIPSGWLLDLIHLYGIHPDWIVLGIEPKFLAPTDTLDGGVFSCDSFPLTSIKDSVTVRKILQCLPDEDLANEVKRRRLSPLTAAANYAK